MAKTEKQEKQVKFLDRGVGVYPALVEVEMGGKVTSYADAVLVDVKDGLVYFVTAEGLHVRASGPFRVSYEFEGGA